MSTHHFNDTSNSPLSDPPPKLEDYPDVAAYLKAEREYFLTMLSLLKASFDEFRDDFIALENPTREQADFYSKQEHRYRTLVGMIASLLRETEWWFRNFRKDDKL